MLLSPLYSFSLAWLIVFVASKFFGELLIEN